MNIVRAHPLLSVMVAALGGYVFAKQIGSIPLVSKIPQKS